MLISVDGARKNQLNRGQESMGMLQCCHIVLSSEILDLNRPVCWSIVLNEKQTAGSPLFGVLPSDSIPQMTKDVNAHFFIHSFTCAHEHIRNFFKLYKRIWRIFLSYCIPSPLASPPPQHSSTLTFKNRASYI